MADPNVFRQFLQPVKSVQDFNAEADGADMRRESLVGARRQNALLALTAQQQAQDSRNRMTEGNALRQLAQQHGGNSEAFTSALMQSGMPGLMAMGEKRQTDALGRRKTEAEISGQEVTTAKGKSALFDDRMKQYRTGLDYIESGPGLSRWMQAQYQDPVVGQFMMETMGPPDEAIQSFQKISTPEQFANVKKGLAMGVQKVTELQQARAIADQGDATSRRNVDVNSATSRRNTDVTNATSRANNAASVGATLRGQSLSDGRARDLAELTRSGAAKAPSGYDWGPATADGRRSLVKIPGGPADVKDQTQVAGQVTVQEVTASLRDQYRQLDESGGITNPASGSLSNLQAGIRSSAPGQAAGRLFGTQDQSMRNTIAQQRPLLLQAIMKATGMSAKQMDSNAELKLYLATATDPTLDVAANMRALDMIESLYGGGKKAAMPAAAPSAAGNLTQAEQAELDALRKQLGKK